MIAQSNKRVTNPEKSTPPEAIPKGCQRIRDISLSSASCDKGKYNFRIYQVSRLYCTPTPMYGESLTCVPVRVQPYPAWIPKPQRGFVLTV